MPYKDPEKEKEYHREYKKKWVERNRERHNTYLKEWREKNKDKVLEKQRNRYWLNREKEIIRVMEGNKRRYRRQRLEVIEHYGGKCKCCGEERIQFLGIDHINGGGTKHRDELKTKHKNISKYLIDNGFPEGYQVLCHNCNLSYGFYGFCPHQIERGEVTEEDIVQIELKKTLERKKKHD
ncbi:MAG: hypothetical protein Q8P40_09775 [Nitrospirota bacterium]|nr:hypothetical protein [Nitrospirota bacterium]